MLQGRGKRWKEKGPACHTVPTWKVTDAGGACGGRSGLVHSPSMPTLIPSIHFYLPNSNPTVARAGVYFAIIIAFFYFFILFFALMPRPKPFFYLLGSCSLSNCKAISFFWFFFGHSQPTNTHQCTIHWMPVILLTCGWTSTELVYGFTLVTNSVRNRSHHV